jgi:hypothetical protein
VTQPDVCARLIAEACFIEAEALGGLIVKEPNKVKAHASRLCAARAAKVAFLFQLGFENIFVHARNGQTIKLGVFKKA